MFDFPRCFGWSRVHTLHDHDWLTVSPACHIYSTTPSKPRICTYPNYVVNLRHTSSILQHYTKQQNGYLPVAKKVTKYPIRVRQWMSLQAMNDMSLGEQVKIILGCLRSVHVAVWSAHLAGECKNCADARQFQNTPENADGRWMSSVHWCTYATAQRREQENIAGNIWEAKKKRNAMQAGRHICCRQVSL